MSRTRILEAVTKKHMPYFCHNTIWVLFCSQVILAMIFIAYIVASGRMNVRRIGTAVAKAPIIHAPPPSMVYQSVTNNYYVNRLVVSNVRSVKACKD